MNDIQLYALAVLVQASMNQVIPTNSLAVEALEQELIRRSIF